MPKLNILTRNSEEISVEGTVGRSVMDIIRDAGVGELLALCGGCCSCATCHVHVDAAYIERLSPMSADEDDLLEAASDRNANSRLSCQIKFSNELDGLRIKIAKED